jgi:hypothetical protein
MSRSGALLYLAGQRTAGASSLAYPPPGWPQAWTHVAGQAKGALDTIREEVHAGLSVMIDS